MGDDRKALSVRVYPKWYIHRGPGDMTESNALEIRYDDLPVGSQRNSYCHRQADILSLQPLAL